MPHKEKIRVFVSYARDDKDVAKRVRKHLRSLGVTVLGDHHNKAAKPFAKQIQDLIANSHVFLPILTKISKRHPWVHQEIGYAVGLNVPVMPVTVGIEPEGLVHDLHALELRANLKDLPSKLTPDALNFAIDKGLAKGSPIYVFAEDLQERTTLLRDYAESVLESGRGRLKQIAGFSSFSIPDVSPRDAEWGLHESPDHQRSESLRKLLRSERKTLTKIVKQGGCDLIIKPTIIAHPGHPQHPLPTTSRLERIREFLDDLKDSDIEVGVFEATLGENVTIVDNWFLADAAFPLKPGGYQKTVFTRHGPTIRKRVRDFDQELQDAQQNVPRNGKSSRAAVIDMLTKIIRGLKK